MRGEAETLSRDADWRWASTGISPAQALMRTEELSSSQIARVQIDDRSGRYKIAWQHYGMGPANLNFLTVAPQQVRRTRSMAVDDRNDGCDLLVMRSGTARMRHGQLTCDLDAGSMILLDCSQPWDLLFPADSHCLTAHMDSNWLRRWLPDPTGNAGRRIDANHLWAAPLAAMLSAIASDGLERAPVPRALLADQLGSLLALAAGQMATAQSRHTSDIVRRIRRAVRGRFDTPDLSADSTAREIGISRRYLDKLLGGTGTTFLILLEEQRLSTARARLTDPYWARETISEVAWSCGFTDPGYFARRFSRRFGASPTNYRKATIGSD